MRWDWELFKIAAGEWMARWWWVVVFVIPTVIVIAFRMTGHVHQGGSGDDCYTDWDGRSNQVECN